LSFLLLILLRLIVMQLGQYPYEPTLKAQLTYSYLDEIYHSQARDNLMAGVRSARLIEPDSQNLPKKELIAWLASPGFSWVANIYGQDGGTGVVGLLDFGMWLLVVSTFLGVLSGRFMTGSWMIGLIAGTAIIYRESVVLGISAVGPDRYLQFFFMLWFAGACHFLKTGSLISLGAAVLAVFCGSLFDGAYVGIALGIPIMLLFGHPYRKIFASRILRRLQHRKRLRNKRLDDRSSASGLAGQNESFGSRLAVTIKWMVGQGAPEHPNAYWASNISRGGLFRAIQAPFGLWVFRKNRWKHLIAGWAIVFIVACLIGTAGYEFVAAAITGSLQFPLLGLQGTSINPQWISLWVMGVMDPLDIHCFISFAVLFVCAVQSPTDGLFSFLESTWMLIITLLCLLFFAFTFDMVDYRLIEHFKKIVEDPGVDVRIPVRQVFFWCEPALLTIGISGVYNLIKVADSRLTES
jgi:hypothetical protein